MLCIVTIWQIFYQILKWVMSKLASLDTMIITTLFFIFYIISSLLRVIWGYFYRCLFLQIYKCFWYYSDCHYTKNNLSCHVLLCWGLFWHILGPILMWGILFLENRSIFFSWNFLQIFKNFMALFYGLGSTVSWLQSHYEETVYF